MCGRTVCSMNRDKLRRACTYHDKRGRRRKPEWRDAPNGNKYFPSYNVAPGSHTPVLMSSQHNGTSSDDQERVIQPMLWGLVPSWHKGGLSDKAFETNNCRAESMLEKQTYKVPLQKGRRCVVLAEGFYEWQRGKASKQPYYIYFPQLDTSPDVTINRSQSPFTNAETKKGEVKHEFIIKNETKQCGKTGLAENIIHNIKSGNTEQRFAGNKDCNTTHIDVKGENTIHMKSENMEGCLTGNKDYKTTGTHVTSENTHIHTVGEEDIGDLDDLWDDWDDDDHSSSPRLLTMAGVFDVWKPPDGGEPVYSYSVITVDSSPAVSWIHHRMPAILTCDEEVRHWLDYGDVPISQAMKLIRPVTCLQAHPVSTVVNNSRHNTPDNIKKIDPSKPKSSASSSMMAAWLGRGHKSTPQTDTPPPNKKLKVS